MKLTKFSFNKALRLRDWSRPNSSFFWVFFTCLIVLLAFILPAAIYHKPFGTDVYTHMAYTEIMIYTSSLSGFYKECFERVLHPDLEYNVYNYPFGLWMFGSILSKISGLSINELVWILPVLVLFVLLLVYYAYARVLLGYDWLAIFSLILFISMPNVSLSLLEYRSSVFAMLFLLSALYFMMQKRISLRNIFFISLLSFCLCITHVGTYMFFLNLIMISLFIYAILWGRLEKNIYGAFVVVLLAYLTTTNLFPELHHRYVYDAAWILESSKFFSSLFNLSIVNELAMLYYEKIFVEMNPVYAGVWCTFIYAMCKIIGVIRSKVLKLHPKYSSGNFPLTIPLIGSIEHISHSVLTTPFWIGPVHSIFSLFGFFRLGERGKSLFLATIIVCIPPAVIYTGTTGALRFIYYFQIIIPIASAHGFYYILSKVSGYLRYKTYNVVLLLTLFLLFSSFIVVPILANLYYRPIISGSGYEINGMKWLGDLGTSKYRSVGRGYRYMIDAYANIANIENYVKRGGETKTLREDLSNIYFSPNSEDSAKELYYLFGVKYIFFSDKIVEYLRQSASTYSESVSYVDSNTQLDKIYASTEDFGLYNYVLSHLSYHSDNLTSSVLPMYFSEEWPIIDDVGSVFLVETDTYKIHLDREKPKIKYVGNKTVNFIEDGYFKDYVGATLVGGPYPNRRVIMYLEDLNYSSVKVQNNQIIYKTLLYLGAENWTSMTISYTFYQKAVKKEIHVSNDYLSFNQTSSMEITSCMRLYSTHFPQFTFQKNDDFPTTKEICACEDTLVLPDLEFNKIYFGDGSNGIYFKYEKTAPYPERIRYRGCTRTQFYSVDSTVKKLISPGSSMHITQYFSIGDETTARTNIEKYDFISLYPYTSGQIPIILTGDTYAAHDTDFKSIINAHNNLKELNVSHYAESVSLRSDEINVYMVDQLLSSGVEIIGQGTMYGINSSLSDLATQEDGIRAIVDTAQLYSVDVNGFRARDLQYNLDTLKILSDYNFLFDGTATIGLLSEGYRHPQFMYYEGEKTDLVLLPMSTPIDEGVETGLDWDKMIQNWKSTINLCVENGELCMFLWRSERISDSALLVGISDVVGYAQEKGMTFASPKAIAEDFRLLQNITTIVSKDAVGVRILVINNNDKPINGVTFVVKTPKINRLCSYESKNGSIVRVVDSPQYSKCVYYLATDMNSREQKEVILYPNISQSFMVKLDETLDHGTVVVSVKNTEGYPVEDAVVTVGDQEYVTDVNGELKIYLSSGTYNIEVQKSGFYTKTYKLQLKNDLELVVDKVSNPSIAIGLIVIILGLLAYVIKYKRVKTQ